MKGLELQKAAQVFHEIAVKLLLTIRPDVLEMLNHHRSQGHAAVLVFGTFQEVLDHVASRLGVSYTVGTCLEKRDGHYTGGVQGPFCFGEAKARLLLDFLNNSGLEVDMTASYAYGDRMYDIPFLELVGNPVAVCPDERLLAHARERGWQVVGD